MKEYTTKIMSADMLQQLFEIDFAEAFVRLQESYEAYTSQAQYENTKSNAYCPDFGICIPPSERDDSLQREENLEQDEINAQKFLNSIQDDEAREKVELRTAISRAEFDPFEAQKLQRLQEEWEEMRALREQSFNVFVMNICELREIVASPVPEIEIEEKVLGYKQDIIRHVHGIKYQNLGHQCRLKNSKAPRPDFIQFRSQTSTYLSEPIEITGEK